MIVESPAKAKTIAGYLGKDYMVESSIGHIRDLPHSAAEIPAEHKKEPWARLGVDVDNDFEPLYVVDPKKKKVVTSSGKLKYADELCSRRTKIARARRSPGISSRCSKPKVPVRRMVFHEITRAAIERALDETREIDERLVDAQETRRILDRLYGYEVSPVLWRKVMQRAFGRARAVRRDAARRRARARADGVRRRRVLGHRRDVRSRRVRRAARRPSTGSRVAQGRDFARDGTLTDADAVQLDEDDAAQSRRRLEGAAFTVRSVEEKPYTRRPAAPFMTSTLQQEASRKLRLSAQQTMRIAQRLYENGYITYMRTDSTTLSESALAAARDQARELYGAESVPPEPRQYNRKVKNAQEAHEAIRPAGDRFRTPDEVEAS